MKLKWTESALNDLDTCEVFIGQDNPVAAIKWSSRIREKARRVKVFPNSGRIVPEFGREDVQEIVVGAYRVIYRMTRSEIYILRVWHSARQLTEVDIEEGDNE